MDSLIRGKYMQEFTTPKGTKLPLINLKGKDYLEVAHRTRWFREENPKGKLDTELVQQNGDFVTYKAFVFDKDGVLLATAYKTKFAKSDLDYDKCETGALGRALGRAGYGTQFTEEDEEIVDAPIERGIKNGTSRVSGPVASVSTTRSTENSTGSPGNTEAVTNWGPVGFDPNESLPFENENDENPVPKEIRKEKELHQVPKPNGKTYFLDEEVDGEDKMTAGKHVGKTLHELMLEDEANDFNYARWIMRELHQGNNKLGIYQRKYITYVKQSGLGGSWL
jgi:hypothetical protein